MKQLKDYLHLYLGCEGQLTKKRSYGSPKRTTETLTTALLNSIDQIPSIYSFKPILRPLSDMTEAEFSEFKILCEDDFSKMVVIESVSKNGDYTRLCHQAKSQAYLLSKHFDLFGLIEAGLAIDKTILK